MKKIKAIEAKAAEDIKALKDQAVSELVKRISDAKGILGELEKEYSALTGKDFTGKKAAKGNQFKDITLAELTSLVTANGGKASRKIINDAGFSLKSALEVAKANPLKFTFEQKGPQGSVSAKK